MVIERTGQGDVDTLLAGQQAPRAVEQLRSTQAQPIAAGEYPLVLVEHVRRGDAQTTVTDDLAATVVQLLSEVQRHHALAGNLADAVVHLPGRDVHALVASDTASVIV